MPNVDREHWPVQLAHILTEQSCVLVSIVEVRGSAPRALGARMIVSANDFAGSVGGGNLEFQVLETARELLSGGNAGDSHCQQYGLGPALQQCCGGAVRLRFEVLEPPGPDWLQSAIEMELDSRLETPVIGQGPSRLQGPGNTNETIKHFPGMVCTTESDAGDQLLEDLRPGAIDLYLFGAGHVGKAVVRALQDLPLRLHWFDPRPEEFPEQPPEILVTQGNDMLAAISSAPAGALFLVMSHSHQQDEEICHAILDRGDFKWLGLIGSETKRARFVHRLAQRGIARDKLENLTCPIGAPGLLGKRPATIAIAVAAQLLAEQIPPDWK